MSELRNRFIEALEIKGYRKPTIRNYVQAVKQFSDFIKCSPVRMTRDHVHTYRHGTAACHRAKGATCSDVGDAVSFTPIEAGDTHASNVDAVRVCM